MAGRSKGTYILARGFAAARALFTTFFSSASSLESIRARAGRKADRLLAARGSRRRVGEAIGQTDVPPPPRDLTSLTITDMLRGTFSGQTKGKRQQSRLVQTASDNVRYRGVRVSQWRFGVKLAQVVSGSSPALVRRWLLNVVDNDQVDRSLGCFQYKSELLLNGSEDGRTARINWRQRISTRVQRHLSDIGSQ